MRLLYLSGARNYLRFKIDPFRDPSFIYRLHNPAISATKLGHKVGIKHLLDLNIPFVDKGWDVAIIHRPSFNSTFVKAVRILRNNNIPIYGDFDDLIFSIQHASDRPSVKNGIESLEQSISRINNHLKAIELINGLITSNLFLANMLSEIPKSPKNILVMNNSWHFSWYKENNKVEDLINSKFHGKKKLQLNYFSGTRTHDLDLSIISEPLYKILKKHKNLVFVFIGKGSIPNSLNNRALKYKKIHFTDYHTAVSKAFINLAPLEITTFNNAKSALKIIEAGFFGINTVCSPIPEYKNAPEISRTIALSYNEWEESLEYAIESGHNFKMTINRMEEVRSHYDPLTTIKKLICRLESLL